MKEFILRIEGIDFDNTVYDTQNMSIIRGSSLALLYTPQEIEKFLKSRSPTGFATIFTGASQGAFRFQADDEKAAKEVAQDVMTYLRSGCGDALPTQHLSFVVDVAEIENGKELEALHRAHAKNRLSQMQKSHWPMPKFEEKAKGFAKNYDRVRPATKPWNDKKEQEAKTVRDAPEADSDLHKKGKDFISLSAYGRFKFGRNERENFYPKFIFENQSNLKEQEDFCKNFKEKATFCNSFEAIVGDADEYPSSFRNKIAVFYADGNKFGTLFHEQTSLENYTKISNHLVGKQRHLLRSIVDWLDDGAHNTKGAFAIKSEDEKIPAYRFETLLCGGDELCFVMPAWLGLTFAKGFFEIVKDWEVPAGIEGAGAPLTFSAGLVMCHHKTPIRQAKKVAKDLAEIGKNTLGKTPKEQKNTINIEIFESIAMPDKDVTGYRRDMYGVDETENNALGGLLTLDLDTFERALSAISELKTDFPRSQIYKFLAAARDSQECKGILALGGSTTAKSRFHEAVEDYFTHAGAGMDHERELLKILTAQNADEDQCIAYSCALIAALWDYVDPLDEPLLEMKAKKSEPNKSEDAR